MAIKTVRIELEGIWYPLTYNTETDRYEATLTAPGSTSYIQPSRYFPVKVEAENDAGTKTVVDDFDPVLGYDLMLFVREKIPPVITVVSPGQGAVVTDPLHPISLRVRDEVGGSGANPQAINFSVDGNVCVGGDPRVDIVEADNGYDLTFTPTEPYVDGVHSFSIDVWDYDYNKASLTGSTFTVDTVPPELDIFTPQNGFITSETVIELHGETSDETSGPVQLTVTVNGGEETPVPVDADGVFKYTLTLAEGDNTIVVTARDGAGKTSQMTVIGRVDLSEPEIRSVTLTPNPVDAGQTMLVQIEVV